MEHLSLEIFDLAGGGSKYAVLPKDASITITDTSEIFASGDVWSHAFTLNVEANAHIFGSAGDMHGNRLHEQIDKRKARLWVEGVALYLGCLRLDGEAEVDSDGNVDVTFESGQKTFEEMIDGAKANQVPMLGDVEIGMALWKKRWTRFRVKFLATYADEIGTMTGTPGHLGGGEWYEFSCDGENEANSVQEYPQMVYPRGSFDNRKAGSPGWNENFVNTDYPYTEDQNGVPTHPYCNIALCYQQYGYKKKMEDRSTQDDYSGEPEAQRGYEYMPADRVNSAPNFFVIYWLRALMTHLGIHIDENQMMDVEDLRRLFFVNSKCAYEMPKRVRNVIDADKYGSYMYSGDIPLTPEYRDKQGIINVDECRIHGSIPGRTDDYRLTLGIAEIAEPTEEDERAYRRANNCYHRAYATSECFPDVEISDVIKAVENGFGVRFMFSEEYHRVRIVLLRSIFRSDDVQEIPCVINDDYKVENNIRGFRLTYGSGKDDTHFFYKGFDDKMPHQKTLWPDTTDKHDYSHWDLDAVYGTVINKVTVFNKTCYVTPNTGNAYGVKVDKHAKRYEDMHPSLFEFAGFMDAEDGDCTGDEDTIKTVDMGFTPAIMNDLNMEEERNGSKRQRFALFVDEKMRPRRPDLGDLPPAWDTSIKSYDDPRAVYDTQKLYAEDSPARNMMNGGYVKPGEFAITSDTFVEEQNSMVNLYGFPRGVLFIPNFSFEGCVSEGYRLYLQDNFEPNDTGVTPIETHDWGLTLGIMRGSGSDAHVDYSGDPDDKEGNDTWDLVSGSSVSAHPDTCDSYGGLWEYPSSIIISREIAEGKYAELYPASNASFAMVSSNGVDIFDLKDASGTVHKALFVTPYPPNSSYYKLMFQKEYIVPLSGHTAAEIVQLDKAGRGAYNNLLVELDSSYERCDTLRQLIRLALGYESDITIDHCVSSKYGRFSLKLRAEKPNPYFDPKQPESGENRRYLDITNQSLRERGLMDQFYKEYSYFIRNARIAKITTHMELAQLQTIDKTKRVRVGDICGFIRKMQYSVSNDTGLGEVQMEIMYI